MSSAFSRARIQAERSKQITHETVIHTFTDGDSASFSYGDVGFLHNLTLALCVMDMKEADEKFHHWLNRIHTIARTMRRSKHWDWVKPEHMLLVLEIFKSFYEDIDTYVKTYIAASSHAMEEMEEQVEAGVMSEGDYIEAAKGLKRPHEFITGADFKSWVECRAKFYDTLDGKMPTIELIHQPAFNECDGKIMILTK